MKFKIELPELDTRSVLDVVEENFQRAELKSFAICMLYTGEYALEQAEMRRHFTQSVHDVNAMYCDINITGILLLYDSYFVHIIEGSEDTVHRQLRLIFKREQQYLEEMARHDLERESSRRSTGVKFEGETNTTEKTVENDTTTEEKPERKFFKRLKTLMVYHSIKAPKFKTWRCLQARPLTLVSKLDIFAPLSYHIEQLRVCLDKLTQLVKHCLSDHKISFNGLTAADPIMSVLPEIALLDFLLQSPHLLDLRHVFYLFRRIDDYIFYYELVWPLPTQYTPRHLYKLKVDDQFVEPLPVMPWEKVEETEQDEEREERQSDSDDSI